MLRAGSVFGGLLADHLDRGTQLALVRQVAAIAALEGHVAEHPGREGAAAVLATALR